MTAKVAKTQPVHLDGYCGVDAQSKSVFEEEHEADVPQTRVVLLDKTGNTIHTLSRLLFRSVLMIVVETGRMKKSLSRGDLAQNERTAISGWQTFYYDQVISSLKSVLCTSTDNHQLHCRAATDRAATTSVPGYDQHPALESHDDAVDNAYENSHDDSDGGSDIENTVSISSIGACCSTTSEVVGSDIDKQGLINAPGTHGELSYTPARLGCPRSQMPLPETCPICEIEDSDKIQAMIIPCCGRFVHELCNDEVLEEIGKCWNCKKEQKSSSGSTAWTCSKPDEYIVHFAASPERILGKQILFPVVCGVTDSKQSMLRQTPVPQHPNNVHL